MDTLGKEGLCDMYSWLQLMETRYLKKPKILHAFLSKNKSCRFQLYGPKVRDPENPRQQLGDAEVQT